MSIKFNPLSLMGLDFSGGQTGIPKVADAAERLALSPVHGDIVVQLDLNLVYEYNGTAWVMIAGPNFIESIGTFGDIPSSIDGLTIVDNQLFLTPATAAEPGGVSINGQTFGGDKTFVDLINADGGIDTLNTTTLAIGTNIATTINIGNALATINLTGTVNNNNVTNLNVTDQLITINSGGGAGSASGTGLEIEENAVITGYVKTSGTRDSFLLKSPASVGIVTLTPGASGFTIDQGSHNPVTIGTANGLSLSTQALSLGLSSTSTTGALSNTDWNTFNGKQNALTIGDLTETTSSVLTVTGGTGAIIGSGLTIEVKQATGIQSGYLTAADWLNFDSKEPALTKGNLTEVTSSVLTITGGTNSVIGSGASIEVKQASGTQSGYLSSADWTTFNGAATNYANKDLSNLTTPETAINTRLVPNKTYSDPAPQRHLGTASAIWHSLYVYKIADDLGRFTIDVINRTIHDDNGDLAIDFNGVTNTLFAKNLLPNTSEATSLGSSSALFNKTHSLGTKLYKTATTNNVELSGSAVTTSYVLNLPPTQGTANQVMVNDGSGNLSWATVVSTGDIPETSFTSTTDVIANDTITGLAFSNASIRSFRALVSVYVDATTDLFATYDLLGVQKSGSWSLSPVYVGDDTNIVFSITNAGQIQYTSVTTAGFVSRKISFRATVLGV